MFESCFKLTECIYCDVTYCAKTCERVGPIYTDTVLLSIAFSCALYVSHSEQMISDNDDDDDDHDDAQRRRR